MIRMRLVAAGKMAALALFVSIAGVLAVYLILRNKPPDPGPASPKLQGRVVAAFSNTRYAHEVEGRVRFVLTAGTDRAFEDGTHELEHVTLESRAVSGERNGMVTADRARVSDPSDLNKLDAEFISNVVLETADGLLVKTNYLHYDHSANLVDTKELVNFERNDLFGHSLGARIEATAERVNLLSDVDLTLKPQANRETGASGARTSETPEARASRKARKRARKLARRGGGKPHESKQPASHAGATAVSAKLVEHKPTRIQCQSALLEKKEGRITFTGNVTVTQGAGEMHADRMVGFIGEASKLDRIEARGNTQLRQADRFLLASSDMDFFLDDGQQLRRALATGEVHGKSLGAGPLREASATTVEVLFKEGAQGSNIDTLKAEGNSLLRVQPAEPIPPKTNPATRELTAGVITMQFLPDGRSLQSAEAIDNAVMTVTPVRAEPGASRKTVRAPKMNALFYEDGNRLKSFEGTGGVRVEIEAMVRDEHAPRITTSRNLTAEFTADTQDVGRLVQEGDFKFNEADRNATADRATYDGSSEVLDLRGGRPRVWDSTGSTQADEIDCDRQKDQVHARGDVRTTYYRRETPESSDGPKPGQGSDSMPFENSKAPVYVTADRGDADNKERIAIFTGSARAWQDDNFIRGDRIDIHEKDKLMVATGNVDSALYSTSRKSEKTGKPEVVPGFASSERMTYSDSDRRIHYSGAVKARQGADRIDAESIEVFLMKETNEVDRLTADGNVALTQPGRRGNGDRLVYTSEDGKGVLEGKSAKIEDDEKGITMGSQLTFYSRDDRVFVDNRQGTGRVRSVHRLNKGK